MFFFGLVAHFLSFSKPSEPLPDSLLPHVQERRRTLIEAFPVITMEPSRKPFLDDRAGALKPVIFRKFSLRLLPLISCAEK